MRWMKLEPIIQSEVSQKENAGTRGTLRMNGVGERERARQRQRDRETETPDRDVKQSLAVFYF